MITCKEDLLAAVLSGMIDASSQVRSDGTDLWTDAHDNRFIAPILPYPYRIKRARWVFLAISLALGALLIVPILASGFQGWRSMTGFAFVGVVLHESYKAAIEAIELSLGQQILLYVGGVALAIAGFVVCDALIELARLTLFPQLEPDSGWLTLALVVGVAFVLVAIWELLWDRWKSHRWQNRERNGSYDHPNKARSAQMLAKRARFHGLLGIEKCGRQVWTGGDRYEGELNRSERAGHGVFTSASGIRYEGEWQKGERHGCGVEILPDGTETAGRWQEGRRVGGAD